MIVAFSTLTRYTLPGDVCMIPIRHDKTADIIRLEYNRSGSPVIRVPVCLPLQAGQQFLSGWRQAETTQLREPDEARLLTELTGWAGTQCQRLGVNRPTLLLQGNDRYWGRCEPASAVVSLHPDLSRMPEEVAREVLLHELCHLIVPNHTKDFWHLMNREMPDWPEKEGMLRCLGKRLRAKKRQYRASVRR